MTTRKTDWPTYAMLAATILFWAGNSIVGRAVRDDIDPVTLALLRWIGASLVVAPFAMKGLREDLPVLRAAWKQVLALCLTGVVGFNTLLYAGLQHTAATNALLMQAMIPGLLLLLGAAAFKQREPRIKTAGILISMFGALFTIFRGSVEAVLSLELGRGDLIVFTACLVWATYTLLLRFMPKVRPASFLFVTFAGGALALLPIAALVPGHHIEWNGRTVLALAYVSVLPSVASYFLYNAAVARAGPAIAGQAISMMPVFGALLASLLLGEVLHWYHALGMAIIVGGIALASRATNPGQ